MKVEAIYGPPGTGKTRKLVEIAQQLTASEGSALYLSFTKAAAQEAISRLPQATSIRASTLHSYAFSALRMSRAAVVDRQKLTAFGKESGFPFMGTEFGSDEPQEGDDYATVLAFSNNRQMDLMDAYTRFGKPGTLRRFEMFVTAYRAWKKTYGYMDFDDMLMKFVADPGCQLPSPVVLLDEAQDCSPLQWRVFEAIAKEAEFVHYAGDDDQAIYEWNGADPHGMASFAEKMGATVTIIKQSHRVPKRVHNLVHSALLDKISKRVKKVFNPRPHLGNIERYGDFTDVDLPAFAEKGGLILVRDNWRSKEVQRELNRLLIPYAVLGGYSPWSSKIAQALKRGERPEIPPMWREFYAQADLSLPVRVNLSTIHQAKGREAEQVIVDLSLSNRVLSNYYTDPDAEARVQYVALTRTSDTLMLCSENPLL